MFDLKSDEKDVQAILKISSLGDFVVALQEEGKGHFGLILSAGCIW